QIQLKIKGGHWENFPLGSQAVKILKKAIGERDKGYVFINPKTGTRYNNISKSFSKAVRKLELKVGDSYLRFHDLRHVFCTWLSNEGVSRDILQILLGHKDRATTDRYTTLNPLKAGKLLEKLPNIRENVARIGKVNV
ncbi:MAG: tyrosine-type recombinase/integrase, partial [Candidatus Helarchaeota archaeon]|nr:tyrosine-type recombinase/integrase [Candidatus Helarchaeota archaeon]